MAPPAAPREVLEMRGSRRVPELNGAPAKSRRGSPKVPKAIAEDEGAKLVWDEVCERLATMDMLFTTDGAAIARYVRLSVEFELLADDIRVRGSVATDKHGQEYQSPTLRSALDIHKQLQAFETTFGLTPSGRSRLAVAPDEAKDEKDDFASRFLGRKKA